MADVYGVWRSGPGSASGSASPRPAEVELRQVKEIMQRYGSAMAQVRVLGPLSIRTFTGPVDGGIRPGALRLAALLALHHVRGRTAGELGVLWPEAADDKVSNLRRSDLWSLRRGLKRDVLAGHGPRLGYVAEYVPYRFGRYRLDQHWVGVDLACFQQLRALAGGTRHDRVRTAAASAALSLCAGELLEGMGEAWAAGPRAVVSRDIAATTALLA